jgi:hypothetical protein
MAKKTTAKKSEDQEEIVSRDYIIMDAVIKDDLCNYSFEITNGNGLGDTHSVKGSGLVKDTLLKAFSKFNVHLAVIDDAFKRSNIEIAAIDKEHGHDLTGFYQVNGFKIKGSKGNENIILIGSKYLSTAGGRMEIQTPKIPLDNLSSYQWYNELRDAAKRAREEVALYKEGNYTPVETLEVEEDDPRQMSLADAISDDQFDKGKI